MKKLESFLYDYSWLLKLGIGILFVFWATNLHVFLGKELRKEITYQKNRNAEEERRHTAELYAFIKKQSEDAEKIGDKYGPDNYFSDLKDRMDLENKFKMSVGMNTYSTRMQQLLYANIKKGFFGEKGIEVARDKFKVDIAPSREEAKKEFQSLKWSEISGWAATLYKRGLLLILILYMVRMSQRKGILGTILADKKRFLISVAAWPLCFSKYPHNVVREIIVEAELRRMGNVFRKLSPKEKLKIQAIANSERYKTWIQIFREEQKLSFRRSVFAALAVTVILNLVPIASAAEISFARGDPLVIEKIQAGNADGSDCHDDGTTSVCISESYPVIALYVSGKVKIIFETVKAVTTVREVDRIPIHWLFSESVLISN